MNEKSNTSNASPLWHALEAETVLEHFESGVEGLEEREGAKRLSEHGPNRIPPPMRLRAQFHNVSIYVLLGAGPVTALLEHLVDACVIIGVVVINGLIGFIQEGRAEKAIVAVHNMLSAGNRDPR